MLQSRGGQESETTEQPKTKTNGKYGGQKASCPQGNSLAVQGLGLGSFAAGTPV